MKVFSISLLYVISITFTYGQTKAQQAFNIGIEINKTDPENYILPLKEVSKLTPEKEDQAGFHIWCQAMSTYSSFVGDLTNAVRYFDDRYRNDLQELTAECDTSFFDTHELLDARDFVLDKAKDRTVVMLNEAHHIPAHRAFALSLLAELYNQGFRYFAIEDLMSTSINQTKLVTDTTGAFYSREPMFGELLREGLKCGFTLLPFDTRESLDGTGRDRYYVNRSRDSLMARNISNIFLKDPKAKVFVYTGYDHIFEGSQNGWKHMGEFLADFTGIDPLSISQSQHMEHIEPKLESKEFRAINNLGDINKPVVAVLADSVFHDQYVDISVISPRYIDPTDRPAYLKLNGTRKPYEVDIADTQEGNLIQAFYDKGVGTGHRIPADQLIVRPKGNTLFLFPGDYNLEVKDSSGDIIRKRSISIR